MDISHNLDRLFKIACMSDATVLITGATGTGKTSLAKEIHEQSKRREKPFVSINLASLHEGVLESELFGHEKGAFTGADQRRLGKLQLAEGGTVFLDEVSELSPRLQARLLEFLQARTFCPVGSNAETRLNVRVIAATHKDLPHAVAQGGFREDLLHRLRVVSIPLQSLSERAEELDFLIHASLHTAAMQANRSILRISTQVAEKFETYAWPGNFRELRNVLDFAILACDGSVITLGDLPSWMIAESSLGSVDNQLKSLGLGQVEMSLGFDYMGTMKAFEKEYLQRALNYHGGRISRTARVIGVSKGTLLRRIKSYQILNS